MHTQRRSDPRATLNNIDLAVAAADGRCASCGKMLPDTASAGDSDPWCDQRYVGSASGDFCSAACQEQWHAARAAPPIDHEVWVEAGPRDPADPDAERPPPWYVPAGRPQADPWNLESADHDWWSWDPYGRLVPHEPADHGAEHREAARRRAVDPPPMRGLRLSLDRAIRTEFDRDYGPSRITEVANDDLLEIGRPDGSVGQALVEVDPPGPESTPWPVQVVDRLTRAAPRDFQRRDWPRVPYRLATATHPGPLPWRRTCLDCWHVGTPILKPIELPPDPHEFVPSARHLGEVLYAASLEDQESEAPRLDAHFPRDTSSIRTLDALTYRCEACRRPYPGPQYAPLWRRAGGPRRDLVELALAAGNGWIGMQLSERAMNSWPTPRAAAEFWDALRERITHRLVAARCKVIACDNLNEPATHRLKVHSSWLTFAGTRFEAASGQNCAVDLCTPHYERLWQAAMSDRDLALRIAAWAGTSRLIVQ